MVSDNINVIIRIGVLELVGCSVTSIKNQKLREKWPKKHQKMAKKVGHAWKSVISSHIEEQFNIPLSVWSLYHVQTCLCSSIFRKITTRPLTLIPS